MVTANYFARYKYLHKAMGMDSQDMYEYVVWVHRVVHYTV
jgi:hypothetical protein